MAIKTGTIWHFSDFHLDASNPTGAPDIKAKIGGSEGRFKVPGFDALIRFIKEQNKVDAATALAITGDLVHQGNWTNPKNVQDIIEKIRVSLGLDAKHVLVIPGNHDVTWRNPKLPRDKMRAAFNEATNGYVKPLGTFRAVQFPSEGLSFLLADTVSLAGAQVGVESVLAALKGNVPDTVKKGELRVIEQAVADALREDIASVPTTELARALAKMGTPLPSDRLGILLAHHPLAPHPYGPVEIKPFEVAIAAGQAKSMLAHHGIHFCLHGHHHSHVTINETTKGSASGFEFFSVASASLTQQPEMGFNIIRYALVSETGEATVSIQSMSLSVDGVAPALDVKRVYVPPRVASRTQSVRVTERINEHGDARSDIWYSEMDTRGWQRVQGKLTKDIPCIVESLGGHLDARPIVESLSPSATASFVRLGAKPKGKTPGDLEHLRGEIRLVAPESQDRVSFAYRLFGNHSYATSLISRVRSSVVPTDVPGLQYDEECLIYTMRTSAKRLEIFIRTPGRAPFKDAVRLVAFREDAGGKLLRFSELDSLTNATIEAWPEAKRIRATVENPLFGGIYGVIWRLQRQEPGLESRPENEKGATAVAEIVRRTVFEKHSQRTEWKQFRRNYFLPAFERILEVAVLATGTTWTHENLELSLFLRDTEIIDSVEFEDRVSEGDIGAPPYLRLIAGNFRSLRDKRLSLKFRAGLGVAGRAYATNRPVGYNASQSHAGKKAHKLFVSPYIRVKADVHLPPHDVLYAFPLRHWEDDGVVLGCLCVGTRGHGHELNLEGVRDKNRTWGEDILDIGRELVRQLADPK